MYVRFPGYDTTVVDALGVSTLVVGKPGSEPADHLPRSGCHTALDDVHRTVLVRDDVLPEHPAVTAGPGVVVGPVGGTGTDLGVDVASTDGGRVLLGLAAWPGYTATAADDTPLSTSTGPLGILEVSVPAGATQLHLEYHVPGLAPSLLFAGMAGVVALAHQVVWLRRRPAVVVFDDRRAGTAPVPLPAPDRHSAPGRGSGDDRTSLIRAPLPRPPHASSRRTVSASAQALIGDRDPVGS